MDVFGPSISKWWGDIIKKICVVILFSLLIISMIQTISADSEDIDEDFVAHPWPSFGRDTRNTRSSPCFTEEIDGTIYWSFGGLVRIRSTPAISDEGIIYFGSEDGFFYALYQNGDFKWNFPTGESIYSSAAIGSDGIIYFGSDDHGLYAVDPEGSEKWVFQAQDMIRSSPMICPDHIIYVGSRDHNFYAINPDGTLRWNFETEGYVDSSPAIAEDGTIYFGSADGALYALQSDGSEKWSFYTGDPIYSSPAIGDDGTIFIGSNDGNLYAINPDGTEKWRFNTGGEIYSSPSISEEGIINIGSNDGNLYAIHPDGTEKWRYNTNGEIYSSPAVDRDGIVYFGNNIGYVYALDADGNLKWDWFGNEPVVSSPAIGSDSSVYVGTDRGVIYSYTFMPDKPSPPVDVYVEIGERKITINWEPPEDTGGGDISAYRIYRGMRQDRLIRIDQISFGLTSYVDTDVEIGESYYYAVSSINLAGEGEKSDILMGRAGELPEHPVDLDGWAGDNMVEITWNPPEYHGGVDLIEYRIYRGETRDNLTFIGSVPSETTRFKDTNVSNRVTYYYRVSAVNAAGESERSGDVNVMPKTGYSLLYCFLLPSLIVIFLLILWFVLWYRRWGNPPEVIMKKDEYDHKT